MNGSMDVTRKDESKKDEIKTLLDECAAMIKEGVGADDLGLLAWKDEVLRVLKNDYGAQSDKYIGFNTVWGDMGAYEHDESYCKCALELSRRILRACVR